MPPAVMLPPLLPKSMPPRTRYRCKGHGLKTLRMAAAVVSEEDDGRCLQTGSDNGL